MPGFALALKPERSEGMFFRVMLFVWSLVLDLAAIGRLVNDEKDWEILLLRQQLRIVERKQSRGPTIPRWQKVPLAAMAVRLKAVATHSPTALKESIRLFKPDTLLGWHRELVRLKWTSKQRRRPGRPPIDAELECRDHTRGAGQPWPGLREAGRRTAETGV